MTTDHQKTCLCDPLDEQRSLKFVCVIQKQSPFRKRLVRGGGSGKFNAFEHKFVARVTLLKFVCFVYFK